MNRGTARVAREAEAAVLERVAAALEAALPELTIELVLSDDKERMHRLTHADLDSPVYVYVQASAFGPLTAEKVLQGKGIAPKHCAKMAHVGTGRGICDHPLDDRGQCGMARMHVE